MTDRRFIEESFPVKEVSAESAREKNIRHGHISTLHIWWARRPLASSRATAYAALVLAPDDPLEREKRRQFIAELSKWENSLNPHILERARRDILEAHAQRLSEERGEKVTVEDIEQGRAPRPRVLDPFAGGGAIPLEAMRLGCEVHASDYNPVAVLILKATLEYPQKYGRPFEGMPEHLKKLRGRAKKKEKGQEDLFEEKGEGDDFNPLLEAVRYWGKWVLEEARKELAQFYPPDPDGSIPVGYIWARTIPCQNPACGTEIPLMRQFWLAKKAKKKVALHPVVEGGRVQFEIVGQGPQGEGYRAWPKGFDPGKGTVARAVATCPVCGSTVDANMTRKLFQEGKSGQRMVAVVLTWKERKRSGKHYRLAGDEDLESYHAAQEALRAKREDLMGEWGMDPVPDEPISDKMPGGFHTPTYGMDTWDSVFNTRQQLALITFAEKVRQAHAQMVEGRHRGGTAAPCPYPEDFARAVTTYLALAVDRSADYWSMQCMWHTTKELVAHTFGRQALQMVWDAIEVNPLSRSTGNWADAFAYMLRVMAHCSNTLGDSDAIGSISLASATRIPHPDGHFDAVLTDPPYYFSVTYADLSDFFYVWLKRSVGDLHPELFSTPLTPKSEEIIQKQFWDRTSHQSKEWYEGKLCEVFREIHRVIKPGGIASVVYAHKTTAGWETVTNALLDSGLVVSGSWPIHTEMRSRLMAKEAAALASSIYIIVRKQSREPKGFYNEVLEALRRHLDGKLESLWDQGIGGADFFISAIGSAIEVFGRYEQVIDYEGNQIRADRLLEDVRTLATDFAVRRILRDGFAGEVTELTRFYVLWRWNFGEARAPFDEARKLAQSCGLDLSREWSRSASFIRKEKEFVRVLGPQDRKIENLADSHELIDVLHYALRLWEKGRRGEMAEAIAASGFGQRDVFYRVAQAISETLPRESKEKRLLDGFLAGRERLRAEVGEIARQEKLL